MTQEDKQLLFIDFSERLPYEVKVDVPIPALTLYYPESPKEREPISLTGLNILDETCTVGDSFSQISSVKMFDRHGELICKPYLRPMSSMTDEEKEELRKEHEKDEQLYAECIKKAKIGDNTMRGKVILHFAADWCNAHHFDYRGLIEKGLAIEAPNDMYKI